MPDFKRIHHHRLLAGQHSIIHSDAIADTPDLHSQDGHPGMIHPFDHQNEPSEMIHQTHGRHGEHGGRVQSLLLEFTPKTGMISYRLGSAS